jgi:hypothetical protein
MCVLIVKADSSRAVKPKFYSTSEKETIEVNIYEAKIN